MNKVNKIASIVCLLAAPSLFGEVSVQLDNVHLCCKACVRAVEEAVSNVEGAKAVANQDAETVVLSAPDKKILRQAITATMQAGFYGTSSDASVKIRDISRAKNEQVKSLTVAGVHLCCNGCVNAVEEALATVTGISETSITRKADSFEIKGDFNDAEVFAALNKAGFAGSVGK